VSNTKPSPLPFPKPLLVAIATARSWFFAISRPARILIGATLGLGLLFGGLVVLQKANEPYVALFSQLDREDAAAIVAKLKEQKVPYRIDADGSTIEVPEARSHELRLELAGGGLPRGGGVGFESFDKMRLGATDFEQRVLYRRALEGELVRTIGTLGAVESTRVHLVLPEKSVFVTRSEPASASIVLRLRFGRTIGSSEVAAIVHLVASAVPSLSPDHIAVVTTDGVTLHKPRSANGQDDGLGNDDDARAVAKSYESATEERVRAMLEKVVGPGHADVRVTADIDSSHVERLEEHFDPTRSALRSEEESIERSGGEPDESVAGIPGAESNLPGGAAKGASSAPKPAPSGSAAASASASAPSTAPTAVASAAPIRESHTRNFEIDKISEKRISTGGALRRLAIAVVLDGARGGQGAPRSREELDQLAALVRSASGANEARGDVVTVESIPFAAPAEALPEAPVAPASPIAKLIASKPWAPGAAVAIALVAATGFFVVMRRGRAVLPAVEVSPMLASAPTPAALEPATLEAAIKPALDAADLRTKAHSRAATDPATAALVLRFWLGTSTPEPRVPAKT
jgi:flagellar M-ring protein FliF